MTLAAMPGTARSNELGDRIAESLCHRQSAVDMPLSAADAAAYRGTDRFNGGYRDTEGPDARAWFAKRPADAVCRRPADWQLTLFFCAAVSLRDGVLSKAPERLCS